MAGRGGRFFGHGGLRLAILHLIGEQPRHGYDLIKAIEEASGGVYAPSPGAIYPTLTLLEEMGHVTASAEGGKKLYAITDEGRSFLEANRRMLDAMLARLQGGSRRGRAPQIVRAMENLKTALRLRLVEGQLSEAEIDAIAAAIDAAATKVEKA